MDRLRSANKDAPFFEPHATLLAGLPKELEPDQIIQTAKSALQDCAPIVCALDDVTTRGFYFQVSHQLMLSLYHRIQADCILTFSRLPSSAS